MSPLGTPSPPLPHTQVEALTRPMGLFGNRASGEVIKVEEGQKNMGLIG